MRRRGKLKPEADGSLLSVAVNFLYPCLIADAVLGNAALRDIGTVVAAPLTGAAILAGSFAITALAARVLRMNRPQPAATFTFTSAIQNWGYLPIPLVQSLFGDRATGVLFVHNIGLELTLWSLGIFLLSGHGSWRRAINIPFLAILGALVLNLFQAGDWLPRFALDTLHFLGQAALPLSLLLTGVTLADAVAQGGLARDLRTTIAACILRLAILPVFILACARFLPCSIELKQILVVQAAMPCALIPVILARHHHGDGGTAVRIVLASTLAGFITILFWLRAGSALVLGQ